MSEFIMWIVGVLTGTAVGFSIGLWVAYGYIYGS